MKEWTLNLASSIKKYVFTAHFSQLFCASKLRPSDLKIFGIGEIFDLRKKDINRPPAFLAERKLTVLVIRQTVLSKIKPGTKKEEVEKKKPKTGVMKKD